MANVLSEYENSVNYLYSLQKHGIKLGLANIKDLMLLLGEPHTSFRSVHIAGTNGKGSTSAAVASILAQNGFRVGLFTSPHLVSFTERISINNQRITEQEVVELASKLRHAVSRTDLNPTFFEIVTAMAFYYFAHKDVDWAVIETGLGGRLDATNVIHPEVTVITNISLDHCEFLGSTIYDITYEKSGIIKPEVPLVTASQNPQVLAQLTETAERLSSQIHIYDRDFRGRLLEMDTKHISINYEGDGTYDNLEIPLPGEYQLYNACTAIRTCEILIQKNISLSSSSIREGLSTVYLEGRLEQVSEAPPIFIDSAHNPQAARLLADSAEKLFPDKKIIIIAGLMGDKEIGGILEPLFRIAATLILTKAKYERAASPEKLKDTITALQQSGTEQRPDSIHSTDTVSKALDLAKSLCSNDTIILVTGSFYTTGEVKEIMGCDNTMSRLREHK